MALEKQLYDLLIDAGLKESEALVYGSLVKSSASTPYGLVERTGLGKSTVYRAVEALKVLGAVKEDASGLSAASLKKLVATLDQTSRKLSKVAAGIRKVSPFLRVPTEAVEDYQHFYDADQVADVYLSMASRAPHVNLDFGDFESFLPKIGGVQTGNKFREERAKRVTNKAICTSFGPTSAYYCTKDDELVFKNKVKVLDIDFRNQFVVFSDSGDYVLFTDSSDDNVEAVLVKSRLIADMQRMQFDIFSQKLGNF